MGNLKHRQSGVEYPLAGRMLIGRATQCPIRFPEGFISREHAVIEYRDGRYWAKALSPLGILVNKRAVEPGHSAPLARGIRISVGRCSIAPVLEMACDSPPQFLAHELNTGAIVVADEHGVVRVPCSSNSRFSHPVELGYSSSAGAFVANDSQAHLLNNQVLTIDGSVWLVHLPSDETKTANLDKMPVELRACTLRLTTDEGADWVSVSIRSQELAGRERLIVSRSRYASTLLVLAEKKRRDLEDGLPERHAGWVTNDELRALLGCRPGHDDNLPYLHPFRLKKLFEAANVCGLDPLFEREHGALRLGVPHFEITIQQ